MKIIKKVLIIFLIVLIEVASMSISANAYNYRIPKDFIPWEYEPQTLDDNHDAIQKAIELYDYCDTLCTYYNFYNYYLNDPIDQQSDFRYGFLSDYEGGFPLNYDYETGEKLGLAIKNVYYDIYMRETEDGFAQRADNEFFLSYYDALKNGAREMEVNNYEMAFLISICEGEKNDNGYYSSELWEKFVAALRNAKQTYNNHTLNGTISIYRGDSEGNTKDYWDLYYAYNDLCFEMSEPGDIDGDGEFDIIDVTKLQRSLVGIMPTLNSAQRCSACVQSDYVYSDCLYPDITDATIMQRKLVGMNVQLKDRSINKDYKYCMCYEVNPIVAYAIHDRAFL